MKFIFGVLLNLGLASLTTAQTTYSSAVTTSNVVTISGSTPRSDDYYKSFMQTLGYGATAMQKIACANANTQNQGFYLSIITSINADIITTNSLLVSNATGLTGAACLSAIQKLGKDLQTVLIQVNDNLGCPGNLQRNVTDGKSGGGLTGEAYYQCAIQEQGRAYQNLLDAGRTSTGTGGTYQQQSIRWDVDSKAVQTVVNANDSSQNCTNAITAFAVDVQLMFASIDSNGDLSCPTASSSTTVIASSTTSTSVSAGAYGYGK